MKTDPIAEDSESERRRIVAEPAMIGISISRMLRILGDQLAELADDTFERKAAELRGINESGAQPQHENRPHS